MKRACDLIFAVLALTLLFPICIIITLLALMFTGPPVFFLQRRVGKGGELFWIWKFRTMSVANKSIEAGFSGGAVNRVTFFGGLLRSAKLDEIPQLWNVIRGEMSIVGPRPEVPEWVDLADIGWKKILSVRPGITDPASIVYRNEEKTLETVPCPRKHYEEFILPKKKALSISYVERQSIKNDFKIVCQTIWAVLLGRGRV